MTLQLVKEGNDYVGAFRALAEKLARTGQSWLRCTREVVFTHFERVGFPTVHDEDWKYTNVAPIAKSQFTPAVVASSLPIERNGLESLAHEEMRAGRLVFVNGIFQRRLSSVEALPTGVGVVDLSEAGDLGQSETRVRGHFERYGVNSENGFLALNTALFSGGVLLVIAKGVTDSTPI